MENHSLSIACAAMTPNNEIIIVTKIHKKVAADFKKWSLTKGGMERIDDGKEENTARREFHEESGVPKNSLILDDHLYTLSDFKLDHNGQPDSKKPKEVRVYGGFTAYEGQLVSKQPARHPDVIRMKAKEYGDYFKQKEERAMFKVIIPKLQVFSEQQMKAILGKKSIQNGEGGHPHGRQKRVSK